MPNWCKNHIEISGHKAKVVELLDRTLKNGLFNTVIQLPNELKEIISLPFSESTNGYLHQDYKLYKKNNGEMNPITEDFKKTLIQKYGTFEISVWKNQNWGTGWEAEITSDLNEEILNAKQTPQNFVTACIRFITGWTPPFKVYERLVSEGFIVDAHYYEPDNNLCGRFKDGKNSCLVSMDFVV